MSIQIKVRLKSGAPGVYSGTFSVRVPSRSLQLLLAIEEVNLGSAPVRVKVTKNAAVITNFVRTQAAFLELAKTLPKLTKLRELLAVLAFKTALGISGRQVPKRASKSKPSDAFYTAEYDYIVDEEKEPERFLDLARELEFC